MTTEVDFAVLMRFCALSQIRLKWTLSALWTDYGWSEADVLGLSRLLLSMGYECDINRVEGTVCFSQRIVFYDKSLLVKKMPNVHVEVFSALRSTNDYGLHRVGSVDKPVMVLAEYQTHGKGQYDRRWDAAFAANILMSCAWVSPLVRDWRGFTQDLGVLICAQLNRMYTSSTFHCKYPNDIMVGSRKLAGILVESETQGVQQKLVVGLGVNVNSPLSLVFAEDRVSLYQLTGTYQDRTALVLQLYAVIAQCVERKLKM